MEKPGAKDDPEGVLGGDRPLVHPSFPRRHHLSVPVHAWLGPRGAGSSRCGEVVGPWAGIPGRTPGPVLGCVSYCLCNRKVLDASLLRSSLVRDVVDGAPDPCCSTWAFVWGLPRMTRCLFLVRREGV